MVKDTTLYNRLEIEPDANETQIKKAYNKLSKVWHPDKHPADKKDEAEAKFKEITEARDVLLDKEKRTMYDQVGMDVFKQPEGNNNPFGDMFGGMGGFPGMPGGFMPGGFMPGGFPGMPGSFNGMNRQGPENIIEIINVTLEQLYNEESVNVNYKQKVSCVKCDGEGSKDGTKTTCGGCNGKGMRVQVIRMGPMIQQSMGPCPSCDGKGKTISDANKCDSCNGKCYSIKDKTIPIPLKCGLTNGNKINLSGKGHQLKNMKTDLIVEIRETPHKTFKRLHDDLFIDIDLKLYQALFGFDKILCHLDGRKLHMSNSSKTDYNTIRKLSGEGMKQINSNNKGDMYIRFRMTLPNLSNIPQDTRNNIKNVLQAFDKNEVSNENQVKTTQNLSKTIMTDCKQDQSEQILNIMTKLSQQSNNMDSDEQEQGQPQCVQQ
jgi:DnaJ family protein A protein 2